MASSAPTATVEEQGGGVVRIAMPFAGFDAGLNVHLVRGDGPLTLVDAAAALPGVSRMLSGALATLGLTYADIEQVVLTHHHLDHIGLTGEVVAAGGARVVANAAVAEVLADPPAHFHGELEWGIAQGRRHGGPDAMMDGARTALPYTTAIPAVLVDHVVDEGDRFAAGDLTLTTVLRPGHSPSDTLFVDQDAGLSFVGDHLWDGSPVTPVLGSMSGPRPAAEYVAGLARTRELTDHRLLAGHGATVDDVAGLHDERLAGLETRIDRARTALTDEPTSTWELGSGIWRPSSSGYRGPARLSALLAALELLAARGQAVEEHDGELVRWRRGG
ncbi:MAG: MBL fold metallo-hydrolase [Patulibacter sp.]|nr:MBL fold metallo-hydrolase [Patulibacter sp.]